jgi:hypothetical protein
MSDGFNIKKVGRIAGGVGLIAVGIPLLALPGPGIITILGGVALLSSEFAWAHGVTEWAKEKAAFLKKEEEKKEEGRPVSESESDDQIG